MEDEPDEKSHPLSRTDGRSSSHLFSLEKLISVAENLTKAHVHIINKHSKFQDGNNAAACKPTDLTYNFIRSLILDNIVENPILMNAFLTN